MAGGEQKTIWVIANWKSNLSLSESLDWLSVVGPRLNKSEHLKVVVCPRSSVLTELSKEVKTQNFPIILGSQDLSPFGTGAFTGEEPAALLKELVGISILGHSERRHNFGETDEMIAKKISQAKENEIVPLLCVQGKETPVPENCDLIAYEPINAISTGLDNTPGSGKADNPNDANEVAKFLIGEYSAQDLKVIYGGSVNSKNVATFIEQEFISGVLVGNASLDPQEFLKIIENCNTV